MNLLRKFLQIGLLLLPGIPCLGCHCYPYIPDFYKNVLRTNLVCFAVCERTGYEYQYNGLDAETAHFRILDPMTLSDQQKGDTILVTGQDGLNCGACVTQFNPGDSIFLALHKGFYYEFGRDTFYLEGACGKYFLEIEEGTSKGLTIPQIKEKISYLKDLQADPYYQMFHPHRALLFAAENENIKGLRIDSMLIDGDAHYYFNPNIRLGQGPGGCDTPYGSSWAGRKVIVKESGDHIFFNRQEDSIILRTWANLGESWRCYEGPDYIIDARIESSDTMSFLGVSDSVKSIRFQVYNSEGVELDKELNQMILLISKKHGVISILDFYLFPDLGS